MSRRLSLIIFWADILLMLLFTLSRWHVDIQLTGEEEMTIQYGETYVDPGANAQLKGKDIKIFDKDLKIKADSDLNPLVPGTYTVNYTANRLFYRGSAQRTVTVIDQVAPVINLHEVKTELDSGDVWSDSYDAYDNCDGDITGSVKVIGEVDTKSAGTYNLTYEVTDASGNVASAERTVVVYGVSEPVTGPKVVFLTFDDGPSSNTERLLDILAKHNAKATFFVTNNGGSYEDLIEREFKDGHTVAVHTLTHDFDTVYSSSEAYWHDFDAMNDIIEGYTGVRSRIFRFPGGSSNTISSFNPGIMTRLAAEAAEKGYDYFDWNVDSNDAGGTTTSEGVYENIISGLQYTDVAVVLCHDTHDYTVNAMDDVLTWCEENGYTLLPLAKGMTVCHHTIVN